MTAALDPAARSTDASSLTKTSNYDAIAQFGCLVGLKPLDTGFEGEHYRHPRPRQPREIGVSPKDLEQTFVVGN